MGDFGWDEWQISVLDSYILGYSSFETQQQLAKHLGKNLNSVKIRLTRRKKELTESKREITQQEYISILANRFCKTTEEVAASLTISTTYLLDTMDELDCLECKEHLIQGFETRPMSNDEYELFIKLHKIKKLPITHIAHILNRNVNSIQEMVWDYERI